MRSQSTTASHLTVPVAGMTCAACEKRVGKALRALPGVETVDVSAPRGPSPRATPSPPPSGPRATNRPPPPG